MTQRSVTCTNGDGVATTQSSKHSDIEPPRCVLPELIAAARATDDHQRRVEPETSPTTYANKRASSTTHPIDFDPVAVHFRTELARRHQIGDVPHEQLVQHVDSLRIVPPLVIVLGKHPGNGLNYVLHVTMAFPTNRCESSGRFTTSPLTFSTTAPSPSSLCFLSRRTLPSRENIESAGKCSRC